MQPKLLKVLTLIAVALALAFPFMLALEKIYESDTFWHLKTGEWIVSHRQIPHSDPFAAGGQSRPWLDWEWLFQAAIYPVYAVGGFAGLVVVKALVVGATGLLLFYASRRGGANEVLAALAVLLAFVAARERLEVRPDVVMFMFAAAEIALLETARGGKANWLWGIPLLQILWVNTHASFPLGVCLIGAYVVGGFVGAVFSRDRSTPTSNRSRMQFAPTAALLATCMACLFNPYGVGLLKHAIEQMGSAGPAGVIGEWQPTRLLLFTEPNWALRVFWWLFWINPLVLIANLIFDWKKFRWEHALLVAGLSVLALRAQRFTAAYAVVTAPVLAGGLSAVWLRFRRSEFYSRHRAVAIENRSDETGEQSAVENWSSVIGISVIGVLAIFLIWAQVSDRWAMAENRSARFGVGLDEQMVPVRALARLKTLPTDAGLFNTYLSGGFLLWGLYPQWQVTERWAFADSRANLYGREFIDRYRHALRDPAEWEKFSQERGVSVVFLQYGTADDLVLLQYLAHEPDWELFYYDHAACIFVRQREASRWRLAGKIAPERLQSPRDVGVVQEYAHTLAAETAGDAYGRGRVLATVGNFLVAIGENASARPLFEEALQLNPRVSQAWMNLAAMALSEQNLPKAMELTDELLRRNPYFYEARLMQAQIKGARGDVPAAVADVERVLRQAPHSAQAWYVRAQLAVRQKDRRLAISALQRVVDEKTEDATVYWFIARLLTAEHRPQEAVAVYERCLQLWVGAPEQKLKVQAELDALRRGGVR